MEKLFKNKIRMTRIKIIQNLTMKDEMNVKDKNGK